MIVRHVAIARFRPDVSAGDISAFREALLALDIGGMVGRSVGPGLSIREHDADFGMVFDFEDIAAFRRFDSDPAHEELRASLVSRMVSQGDSCQFKV
jgi:hypothetical protein